MRVLESDSTNLRRVYESIISEIKTHIDELKKNHNASLLTNAFESIEKSRDILRTHQTLLGALITSTNWQSPSFAHSVKSQAGTDEGSIEATINDYKRDQHNRAIQYEQSFKKNYIDGLITFPVNVYATSSGMAAFSTILSYLIFEKKLTGTILVGASIYFECKALLQALPSVSIVEVNDTDTSTILKQIDRYQPSVIFFDSIANMPTIAVPNIDKILSHIVSQSKKNTILVVDNTCRSIFFQPIPQILGKFSKVSLIVFESLNKYHQFAMDRVTGGIIWCYGGDTGKISNYRVHTGTNIPDVAAASLPTPNRNLLSRKLQRHGRNATFIARILSKYILEHPTCHITSVIYPQLPSHPSYFWTKTYPFSGSFISLQFEKKYQTIASYKRFIRLVLTVAEKEHIPIVSGTSFGLHTTRIYLTAIRSSPTTPFVRISIGTEHFSAIESIAEILTQTLEQFR
jgi:cystathionine beta-lyase/cystathionine gamma-synthase